MAARKNASRRTSKAKKTSADFMEKLKQFVRTKGPDYLLDPNISSIGIGYKVKGDKQTSDLSIQFTVEHKSAPEGMAALRTSPIPATIEIDGVAVPTDVLQRSYEHTLKIVAEATASPRKTRIDPIVPGVSVANKKVSAGTIGCIVYDQQTGAPYVLSNWHVLHGPQGVIGDDVVQPGPHDDNRTQTNRLGKLVRSHLGAAGDCAIASIETRKFKPEILDLGVKAEQLGEPDLGDKVIKSGRTTAVTHGIVTRINTLVKINYGAPVGEKAIGGFEIGPDPGKPAPNGEISQGGDSGSLWLFKTSTGKASNIMAGLHFAGEGPNDPNEHAIACYAKSVFEKLEITLTPKEKDEDKTPRVGGGYAANFLGVRVDAPKLSTATRNDAVKLNNSEIIPYTHFSLTLSKSRRFAIWVAWNIDGNQIKKLGRNVPFILDPRIAKEFQVGDDLYKNNRLDRGHIARRADLIWGGDEEAKQANIDSFYFTNITPQMDNFNQGGLGGIWGKLEDAVFGEVDVDNLRVSVFGGPVFRADDRVFRGVKLPREFYKVIAFVEGGKLKARAFLLTQNLDQLEALDLDEFKVYQTSLAEIEQRCGFTFPANLKSADGAEGAARAPEALAKRQPLQSLSDIRW